MSYQPVAMQTRRTGMSKWWWIGFLIGWLLFVIIGAALLGVWASHNTLGCSGNEDDFGYFYDTCGSGVDSEYYGGLACLAIGGILHLAYWITLIVWCTKRRRAQAVPLAYAMETPLEQKPYGYSAPYQPVPEPTTSYATGGRYCGNCGTVVTSQFCQNCGGRPQ